MNQTVTLPNPVESLDYDPPCGEKSCDKPAVWYGVMACGCEDGVVCQECRVRADYLYTIGTWQCGKCGTKWAHREPFIVWRPL